MKLLHGPMGRERAAVVDDLAVVVERRIDPAGNPCPGEPDAEGLGGLDGSDGVLAEAGDGAQPVRVGGEDVGGGAEGLEQGLGQGAGVGVRMEGREQELEKLAVVEDIAARAQKAGAEVEVAGAALDSAGDGGRVDGGRSRRTGPGASKRLMRRPSGAWR